MNQNIKNFIEESEKEQSYIIYNLKNSIKHEVEGTNIGEYKDDVKKYTDELQQFISSRQISLIKMIEEMVESEKKEYTLTYPNPVYYQDRLAEIYNIALDTISSKLKGLIKE